MQPAGLQRLTSFVWLNRSLSLSPPARPAHDAPGLGSRVPAVLHYLDSVNEDVHHACRVLVRFLERRMIGDLRWVEDRDVRKIARLERSATCNFQVASGQPRQAPNRLFHRDQLLITHVSAEQAGEIAVCPGMRIRLEKYPLR